MNNTYSISSADGETIATAHTGLSREEAFALLDEVEASRFSIGEYDDEDECVGRWNGEEWLAENTELTRTLKSEAKV